MPTVSRQQQKLMHGIASGNIKPRDGLPSKKVAKEFATADHKRGTAKLPQKVGDAIVKGRSAKDL
jgi:hypothetical protein